MWAEAKYYAGMAGGVWDYLRQPTLKNPLDEMRSRVERRPAAFLERFKL